MHSVIGHTATTAGPTSTLNPRNNTMEHENQPTIEQEVEQPETVKKTKAEIPEVLRELAHKRSIEVAGRRKEKTKLLAFNSKLIKSFAKAIANNDWDLTYTVPEDIREEAIAVFERRRNLVLESRESAALYTKERRALDPRKRKQKPRTKKPKAAPKPEPVVEDMETAENLVIDERQ